MSTRSQASLKSENERETRKIPPLHPSYKEESGVLGKDYKLHIQQGGDASLFEIRQKAFWEECLKFEKDYDRQLLSKFFCYWAEEVNGTGMMLWETKKSWNTKFRLASWSKKSYQIDDETSRLRLEHAKGKNKQPIATTVEQQAIAAKRAEDNEKLEREIAERKAKAVSHEEYLKMIGK